MHIYWLFSFLEYFMFFYFTLFNTRLSYLTDAHYINFKPIHFNYYIINFFLLENCSYFPNTYYWFYDFLMLELPLFLLGFCILTIQETLYFSYQILTYKGLDYYLWYHYLYLPLWYTRNNCFHCLLDSRVVDHNFWFISIWV